MTAEPGCKEISKNVLNAGADIDEENNAGKTAIYMVTEDGCRFIVNKYPYGENIVCQSSCHGSKTRR